MTDGFFLAIAVPIKKKKIKNSNSRNRQYQTEMNSWLRNKNDDGTESLQHKGYRILSAPVFVDVVLEIQVVFSSLHLYCNFRD